MILLSISLVGVDSSRFSLEQKYDQAMGGILCLLCSEESFSVLYALEKWNEPVQHHKVSQVHGFDQCEHHLRKRIWAICKNTGEEFEILNDRQSPDKIFID